MTGYKEPERRIVVVRHVELEAAPARTDLVLAGMRRAHIAFERSEMDRRPQLEKHVRLFRKQGEGDMDGILKIRHHEALLDLDAVDVVAPERDLVFQPELGQIIGALRFIGMAWFGAAELNQLMPGQKEAFLEVI